MIEKNFYDYDYYENGIKSKKSLYTNYCWKEQDTIQLAENLAKYLQIKKCMKVLDYGCAKGYLVYAFRKAGIDAFGVDISRYAVSQCFKDIEEYIQCINCVEGLPVEWGHFDCIIAKDVFEHIDVEELGKIINTLSARAKKIFVVVPLGDGEKYIDFSQDMDASHVIKQPLEWWRAKLNSCGWKVIETSTHMPTVKPRYSELPGVHGFFVAESIYETKIIG